MLRQPDARQRMELGGAESRTPRPRETDAGAPTPALVAAAAAGGTVVSVALTAWGLTPAPLLVVTGGVLVLLGAQVARWPLALAGAVLFLLTWVSAVMLVLPVLGVPLVAGDTAALGVLSLTGCALLGRRRCELRLPSVCGLRLTVASLVAPGIALLSALVIELGSGGDKVAWVMSNDSTFNLLSARFILRDGGLDLGRHPNVAPLTTELIGLFIAPGRSSLSPDALLGHDVHRTIEMLLLLLAVMSVVGSVLVAHAVPRHHPAARALLAVAAGLLPWSWLVGGYSLQYGFWNAIITGAALVATWLVWVEVPHAPRRASALIALSACVMVTVWLPLLLVPALLGLVAVLRHWRSHLRMRTWDLVAWLTPVLTFAVFVYILVLPTVTPSASGAKPVALLGVDGAFFALGHATPGVIALVVLGTVLLGACLTGARWELLGVVVLVAAGWLGLHFLMGQRAANPTGPWGYYPQKFAWLLCVLAPFAAARAVAGLLTGHRVSVPRGAGVAVGAALVAAAMVAQIPPADSRPPSAEGNPAPRLAPDWRATSMFFLLSVATEHGASDFDPAARTLFRWSDPHRKVIAAGWFHDPILDSFINFWLLQQPYATGNNETRGFAYSLSSRDPTGLCAAVQAWGGGVTLETRESGLERQMRTACPSGDYTVHYVPGGLVPSPR